MPAEQLRIAQDLGLVGLEEHSAKRVTAEMVEGSDLVLGLSRGHRKLLVRMDPPAFRKTFTLREFAYLATFVTPETVRRWAKDHPNPLCASVRAVASMRGRVTPLGDEELDVIDPFKKSRSVYRRSRDELVPAAETTAAYLNGIVNIFGDSFKPKDTAGRSQARLRHPDEPDVISQGLPQVNMALRRDEERAQSKSPLSTTPFPSRRMLHRESREL